MANVLMVIEPYWYQDTWVFDDESVIRAMIFRMPHYELKCEMSVDN